MGREFELKYRASGEVIAAVREQYGPFTEISMETTYYDTPDRDIRRLRWTLRCRLENGISVCALKTPGSGFGHGEWEVYCNRIEDAIPMLLEKGAPAELSVFASAGFIPTCGARFTRLAGLIDAPACTVELALDEGFLLGGGKAAQIPTFVGAGTLLTAFFMGPLVDLFNRKISVPLLNK